MVHCHRKFYEDQGARLSILAGVTNPRPDTLAQTVHARALKPLADGAGHTFFSTRPIVLSLARSTMLSSTTASSSSLRVHLFRPLGGSEQAKAISLASEAPSKMQGLAEAGECLPPRTPPPPAAGGSGRPSLR
jgi:hypothetical protein